MSAMSELAERKDRRAAFHAHIDECTVCKKAEIPLCDKGRRLLRMALEKQD